MQNSKQIKKILKKEGLTPIKSFDKMAGTYKFHILLCKNINNKKIIFKSSQKDIKSIKKQVEKEFKITNAIYSNAINQKFSFTVPRFLKYSLDNYPYWLTHEYLEGSPMGIVFDFKSFVTNKIADMLAKAIAEIQKINIENFKNQKFEFHDIKWYRQQKNENIIFLKNYVNQKKIDYINDFFNNFPEFKCVPAHQDLSLSNIIYNNKLNKIGIIDWEIFTYDSCTRDLAHLWVHSWKKPLWRNFLIKQFKKYSKIDRNYFEKTFKLSAILELIYYIKCQEVKSSIKSDVKKYYTKKSVQAHLRDLNNLISNKK